MKQPQNISPPKWADRFLTWYCKESELEILRGDVYELFEQRAEKQGVKKARLYFILDILDLFRPFVWKHIQVPSFYYAIDMFRNYLKISIRNFQKSKVYSLINLSGLVVGLTSCLLIGLYVLQELSYDRFHPYTDDTYRVVMDMYGGNELKTKSAPVYPAVGPALKAEFPEVEEYLRILPFGSGVYSRKSDDGALVRFNETKAVFADETFFQVLGFKLLEGDPEEVLAQKQQIVLSEATAIKYFGNENPIGQSLIWRGGQEVIVSGIMEDFPENSHMQFDMITSLKSWEGFEEFPENWGWYDFYTFVKLNPEADRVAFEEKLSVLLDDKKRESYEKSHSREVLWSQPLTDIHLHSVGLSWDMGQNGGAYQVYFLAAVAALILIIAWINFINLATARAVKRAKEVGIRKVVGARKRQLIQQFLTESLLYNTMGVLLALGLVALFVPVINRMLDMYLDMSVLFSGSMIIALVGFILFGALFSGLYPALVLSSFMPFDVLKNSFYSRKKQFGFRQILVVFQFAASIILILGTFMVVKQLHFMQNFDLGLNIEQTIVIHAPTSGTGDGDLENRLVVFKDALNQMPEIKGIAISTSVPGIENFSISGFNSRHFPKEVRDCYRVRMDENFLKDYEIPLIAGRNFMREMLTDSAAVILNKKAVKHMGFESPEAAISEKINPGSRYELNIIGVVDNYHQASVKEALDPVIFFYRPDRGRYYSLKAQTNDYVSLIGKLNNKWDEIYPDNPLDYFFLDEKFAQQYKAEEQFSLIFLAFAGLAIVVACLGLFGLISFTAEQSQKEIGIRKVLGASTHQVVLFLIKDYTKLILVSMFIAFPIAYYLMDQWLQGFAYRTSITYSIFLLTAIVIVLISLLTVSTRSYKAATTNPASVLRNE